MTSEYLWSRVKRISRLVGLLYSAPAAMHLASADVEVRGVVFRLHLPFNMVLKYSANNSNTITHRGINNNLLIPLVPPSRTINPSTADFLRNIVEILVLHRTSH